MIDHINPRHGSYCKRKYSDLRHSNTQVTYSLVSPSCGQNKKPSETRDFLTWIFEPLDLKAMATKKYKRNKLITENKKINNKK